ncbi:MAG: UDP-N-acetylglucosamine 1-carboxyvinyltransferase [Nitrospinaceae bacterium]|nr:UDP-N-acetylglucosamine 1-carboxyvinyltransferase [Nitrospinaceae bacterium]NIR53367.1 UDP-N-acetylglucosamine 1-carboxyvinyltransferase [Nitrospinaceae bacterium]NIS83771.1 UDP-N-acetylglucosamine 1-carboxyvinyltransferase [Nitrospinaceae bacterium]NIT80570.1 UDP-N-acetylglucosamine 1-carboxyvinyltransferase [Nitrospinaceae bacterium]NIU42891.1 UDP-N-acetylglucosamine 1-carboxyvinyltransferase [Nitrospinaceae bacterium]
MDRIIVEGGHQLNGQVTISGAKNAILPVLAATLLTGGKNEIQNVPGVRDVKTMVNLVRELGGRVDHFEADRLVLDSGGINNPVAPYDLVSTMRASCMVLGPLLARLGEAKVSLPGGCAIGARPIDLHIKGLEALGADIQLEKGYVHGVAKKLKGAHHLFESVTVTGTMNVLMAAAMAEGETVLENAAKEPEVEFLADVLNQCGAKIEGAGTDKIIIEGVTSLKPIHCRILPDRIEAATYMIAGAITDGDVEVLDCVPAHLEAVIQKLREAGVGLKENETSIRVRGNGELRPVHIRTHPYPGFATDVQAQFMTLMTLAKGQSVISETVFENRFMHVAELRRMGADIHIEGHTAIVSGVEQLSGAPVMATDLRASACLVLAGLVAERDTVVSRVYHIDRGYEDMEKKLSQLGAAIRRVR